jgi:hypothetical protein
MLDKYANGEPRPGYYMLVLTPASYQSAWSWKASQQSVETWLTLPSLAIYYLVHLVQPISADPRRAKPLAQIRA